MSTLLVYPCLSHTGLIIRIVALVFKNVRMPMAQLVSERCLDSNLRNRATKRFLRTCDVVWLEYKIPSSIPEELCCRMCLLIMCHVSLCDVGARKQKADSSKAASTEALLAEDTSECDTVPTGRSQGDKVWEYVTEVCACSVRVRLALLCVCFRGKKWREKQMKSPGPWIGL